MKSKIAPNIMVTKSQVQINQNLERTIMNFFLPIKFNISFLCSKEPSH